MSGASLAIDSALLLVKLGVVDAKGAVNVEVVSCLLAVALFERHQLVSGLLVPGAEVLRDVEVLLKLDFDLVALACGNTGVGDAEDG